MWKSIENLDGRLWPKKKRKKKTLWMRNEASNDEKDGTKIK